MRALTASERRLGLIFLGLIFVVFNIIALQLLMKKRIALSRTVSELKLRQMEADAWLGQKEEWLPRKAWLDQTQPAAADDGQDPARFLEELRASAQANKVTISQQKLSEPRDGNYFREVSVQLEVKGSLESVTRWLASIQSPGKFQAITKFTLKSDAEPPKVVCTLTAARWFAPRS